MSQKNSHYLSLGADNYNEITERWIAANAPPSKKHHRSKKREHTLLRILKLIIKA
jgi:hypothetical protein